MSPVEVVEELCIILVLEYLVSVKTEMHGCVPGSEKYGSSRLNGYTKTFLRMKIDIF